MPAAHCPICFNDFPIDSGKPEFLIFPCGHGFCNICTENVFNPEVRKKCPICRKLIHRRDAHPVFLELVDSNVAFSNNVTEGIAQMDADTPVLSVKRASQKISKVLEAPPAEDTLSLLLQAVQDFNERIIPVFGQVEGQKKELDEKCSALSRTRRERDELQVRVAHIVPLQTEVQRLRTTLAESERNTQGALTLAEAAKDKLQAQCLLAEQWQKQAAALEKKNSELHELVQRHQSYGKKKRDKCRKLETDLAAAMEQLNGQPVQDMGLDYDGDFSGHEFVPRSQPVTTLRVPASTPIRSSPRQSAFNEIPFELTFEGLPNPNFPSEWTLHDREGPVLKKRTSNGIIASNHRRVTNPVRALTLQLDKKGHPTKAVQLGPKNSIRLGR